MAKHINIFVFGAVQGVLFRHSAMLEAEKLHIKGFAKNASDGSVYIEAEGEEKNLEKFIEWCKKGPNLTKVENLKIEEGDLKNFVDFQTV